MTNEGRQAIEPDEPGDAFMPASDAVWWIAFRGKYTEDADEETLLRAGDFLLFSIQAEEITLFGFTAGGRNGPIPHYELSGATSTAPLTERGHHELLLGIDKKTAAVGIVYDGPSRIAGGGDPFTDELIVNRADNGVSRTVWKGIRLRKNEVLRCWPRSTLDEEQQTAKSQKPAGVKLLRSDLQRTYQLIIAAMAIHAYRHPHPEEGRTRTDTAKEIERTLQLLLVDTKPPSKETILDRINEAIQETIERGVRAEFKEYRGS